MPFLIIDQIIYLSLVPTLLLSKLACNSTNLASYFSKSFLLCIVNSKHRESLLHVFSLYTFRRMIIDLTASCLFDFWFFRHLLLSYLVNNIVFSFINILIVDLDVDCGLE